MERLPYIDEHATPIGASGEEAWPAVVSGVRRAFGGSGTIARALGCVPAAATLAFDGAIGQTLPGFEVVDAEPGRRLVLAGRHRFSRYRLTLLMGDGMLRAQTHAVFPGVLGRLYRAAVIGTGAHRVVTRRLVGLIARRT